jgi:hypothetical protein
MNHEIRWNQQYSLLKQIIGYGISMYRRHSPGVHKRARQHTQPGEGLPEGTHAH